MNLCIVIVLILIDFTNSNGNDANNFIVYILNHSSQRVHCVGTLINCCVIFTSCRCVAAYKYRLGSMEKYPVKDMYVFAQKVDDKKKFELSRSLPHPGCHPAKFNGDVYGNDMGAFMLKEILQVGNASKVKPMKGPDPEEEPEKRNETWSKFVGKSCKVYGFDISISTKVPSVALTILKPEDCFAKLCPKDPKSNSSCEAFKRDFEEEGWSCGSVPKQPHSDRCLPYYGSPIVCGDVGVGIASHFCANQTLLFTRIDSGMRFYTKMLELKGTSKKPILTLILFAIALNI